MNAVPAPSSARYAGTMLGATVLAAGAAWVVAGGGRAAGLAVTVLLIASTATFLPVVLAPVLGGGRWGLGVAAASAVRTLLVLFGGLAVDVAAAPPRREMWLGVLAGAGVVLVAETWSAVVALRRMERARLALKGTAHA